MRNIHIQGLILCSQVECLGKLVSLANFELKLEAPEFSYRLPGIYCRIVVG